MKDSREGNKSRGYILAGLTLLMVGLVLVSGCTEAETPLTADDVSNTDEYIVDTILGTDVSKTILLGGRIDEGELCLMYIRMDDTYMMDKELRDISGNMVTIFHNLRPECDFAMVSIYSPANVKIATATWHPRMGIEVDLE